MCIEPPRPPLVPSTRPKSSAITRFGLGAAGDRVAVGAVGADQVVVLAHHRGGADDRRLLADRQVQEAAGLGPLVLAPRLLLEAADQRHPARAARGRSPRPVAASGSPAPCRPSIRPPVASSSSCSGPRAQPTPGAGPGRDIAESGSGRPAQGVHFAARVKAWNRPQSHRLRPCRRAGLGRKRQRRTATTRYRGRGSIRAASGLRRSAPRSRSDHLS